MAFNFEPGYREEITIQDVSDAEFLAVAIKAVEQLGWHIKILSRNQVIADTAKNEKGKQEEITITIKNRLAIVKSQALDGRLFAKSKNIENVGNLAETMETVLEQFTKEELARTYEYRTLHMPHTHTTPEPAKPTATAGNKMQQYRFMVMPRKNYLFTPIIVAINVIVWLLMVIAGADFWWPDSAILVQWGAGVRSNVLQGEWWRLVTACFIHIGIVHLLLNMYALLIIGNLLEPIIGRLNFLVAYLLTGVCGCLASIWWHENAASCGASGAIFGLDGIFLAVLTSNILSKEVRKNLLSQIIFIVFMNLMIGMSGPIDNAGHTGGLLGGLLIGYILIPAIKKPKWAPVSLVASVMLVIGLASFTIKSIPDDWGQYNKLMKELSANETRAIEMYKRDYIPDPLAFDTVRKDTFMALWQKNIAVINKINGLKLSTKAYAYNEIMTQYVQLRYYNYSVIMSRDSNGWISSELYRVNTDSLTLEGNKLVTKLDNFSW